MLKMRTLDVPGLAPPSSDLAAGHTFRRASSTSESSRSERPGVGGKHSRSRRDAKDFAKSLSDLTGAAPPPTCPPTVTSTSTAAKPEETPATSDSSAAPVESSGATTSGTDATPPSTGTAAETATPGASNAPTSPSESVPGSSAFPECATDPTPAKCPSANQTDTTAALRSAPEAPPAPLIRTELRQDDPLPMAAEQTESNTAVPTGSPSAQQIMPPAAGTTDSLPAEQGVIVSPPAVAVQAATADDDAVPADDATDETPTATPASGERLALFAALAAATGNANSHATSGGDADHDLPQSSTPIQDAGVDVAPLSHAALEQSTAVATHDPVRAEAAPAATAAEQVFGEIATRIDLSHREGRIDFRLRLDPPGMGTVRVHLIATGHSVSAHVVAEDPGAQRVLESQFQSLRESLAGLGVSLEHSGTPRDGGGGSQSAWRWQTPEAPAASSTFAFRKPAKASTAPARRSSAGAIDVVV